MPNFLPDNNIGIVLGRNSGDLVRLDPEWPKALPLMPILFPEPCPRFGVTSAQIDTGSAGAESGSAQARHASSEMTSHACPSAGQLPTLSRSRL